MNGQPMGSLALMGRQLVELVQEVAGCVPADDPLAVWLRIRACHTPNPPPPMITSGCAARNA
jgi:hypothetical protein